MLQQQLRYTVKQRREDSVKTLRKNNAEVKDIEEKIFEVGKKLRVLMEENQRFKEVIQLQDQFLSLFF